MNRRLRHEQDIATLILFWGTWLAIAAGVAAGLSGC